MCRLSIQFRTMAAACRESLPVNHRPKALRALRVAAVVLAADFPTCMFRAMVARFSSVSAMRFTQCRWVVAQERERVQEQPRQAQRRSWRNRWSWCCRCTRRINFNVRVRIDRPAEWAEMFDDGWRTMKYRFYDPKMHGMDWDAVRAKYRPLVDFVGDRQELLNIINEMIGELNASHTGAAPPPRGPGGGVWQLRISVSSWNRIRQPAVIAWLTSTKMDQPTKTGCV
jgi:hypothetical protein